MVTRSLRMQGIAATALAASAGASGAAARAKILPALSDADERHRALPSGPRQEQSDCLALASQWKNQHARKYFTDMLRKEHRGLRLSHLGFDRDRIELASSAPKPKAKPSELLAEPIMLHIREVAVEGKHGPQEISDAVRELAARNFPQYELHLMDKYGAPLAIVAALVRKGGMEGARIGVSGVGRSENVIYLDEAELSEIRRNFEKNPEQEFGRLNWKYYAPLALAAREAAFM